MKVSHVAGAVFRCSSLLVLVVIGAVRVTPQTSPTAQSSDKIILIRNAEVCDGVSNELRRGNVLKVGTTIKQISSAPIPPPPQATVIDAGGRVLMPGLTDEHWHRTMAASTVQDLNAADAGLMYANAVAEAKDTLMRGFTTGARHGRSNLRS
jgi:imidazolonepropionase-like amidohydrolase